MKVLVIGAGALGGYFGGRLAEIGRDVTFLVRPRRAELLREHGLVIESQYGNLKLVPNLVTADALRQPYDLVLLSCKSYDLDDAMAAMAPGVGPNSVVIPVLNGLKHFDSLDAKFGKERVLGGLAMIGATLGADGRVLHLNDAHILGFGERDGTMSRRVEAIAELMKPAKMVTKPSATVMQDLWEKWVMLGSLAGITCLMRSTLVDILAAPQGGELVMQIFREISAVATAAGFAPRPAFAASVEKTLSTPRPLAASMMRDIERGGPTEGDHVLGDLIARAEATGVAVPLLRVAYAHVKTYDIRREREAQASKS